ncbi:MAG: glycosyltransferase [Propionivibrio sp.]|nr:glycosyltransferase [Propionivibrio sp.]
MFDPNHPDYTNHPASTGRHPYPYFPLSSHPPVTVSILTPFYNTGNIFLETVTSVLRQSFQEWEWIIVDDGSTEGASLAVLEQSERLDCRIRILKQFNHGPSAARNKAFASAISKYICLLDSDDLLEPTFLEKAVWFLETEPTFAFCNSWSIYFGNREFASIAGFERGKEFIKANSGPPISVIRSEAFKAAGGFDESIRFGHEDWDFWLRMASKDEWGATLPEYLEWYRVRDNSRYAQITSAHNAHKAFTKYITRKYSSLGKHFPNPHRRVSLPYETLKVQLPFRNLLGKHDSNRRILFLVPWMVTGGADRVNLDWIRGLIKLGYQVSVCATLDAQHEWMPEFAKLTPDVFILQNFLHPSDIPRFIVYLIRSRQIDTVLVTHSTLTYQLLPFLRAFCPQISYVDLSHVEEPHWLNGGHPRFGIGYQEALDLNIVTTRHLRDWMTAHGADPGRIEVCHSGIEPSIEKESSSQETTRHKLGIESHVPLLIFCGRLCAQKRPELLADVLHSLANRAISFHCIIVGDGESRSMLSRRLGRFNLKRSTTMLGTVTHKEWLELLSNSDILLMPSEYEGISVALFEAMVMGVVPVMSDVGGQSELVTPACGVLIETTNNEVEQFADALHCLIVNPSVRTAMASECRHRIRQQFTLNESIARLGTILERAQHLAHTSPRQAVTPALAIELATQAIEYARLTIPVKIPTSLAKILAFLRTYKIGRLFLRARIVRLIGQATLERIRSWRTN